jgi:hypothetical protein
MSVRKLLAAAATVMATFAVGTAATIASAATVPTIPAVAVAIPDVLGCPTWYGRPNPADGACLVWCDSRNQAPCSPPA